ncbi:nodulation protein NfeD [Desulfopila sp. IMCC35008]|uniref:NfeD family protein n=1 Tax=Desulfopila sp. IMCC35008 TaxID=2653858 RepID=UPI0013D43A26
MVILLTALLTSETIQASGQAVLLRVNGPIGPAVSDYLQRGLSSSEELQADVIILQIDTPGGLDHSMRQIIQAILASSVPVITYVAPDGARAASAGTYILYASHLAAMSPATNLGAASPVRIGGLSGESGAEPEERENGESAHGKLDTLERKIINDAAAYIKSLAERHGRNAEWAVKAVREAVSLSAEEALELGVIDIVATDIADLLLQADGREVQMESGPYRISTNGLSLMHIEQSWRTQLLAVISDPNIAYILMLLGIYGFIYEMANPGFFLPGVLGGISLLLAFYAFHVLPVNYSGIALIFMGIALLVAEVYVPSFGSLGIGGIVAFSVGSLILIEDEELRVAWQTIVGTIVVSSAFLIWLVTRLISIRKRKIETGMDAMIGMTGEAEGDFDQEGRILVLGESWLARCSGSIKKGEKVRITGQDGLFLTIEKQQEVV